MTAAKKIQSGDYTFEIVNQVPKGYEIWNIGQYMVDGYLPICEVTEGHNVNTETLKAIKLDGAQTVLDAVGLGNAHTLKEMESYVKRYQGRVKQGGWAELRVQKMIEALPILRKVAFE